MGVRVILDGEAMQGRQRSGMRRGVRVLLAMSAGVSALGAEALDSGAEPWFVEGLVETVDEELAGHVETGWRLEGSFGLRLLEMVPVGGPDGGTGRLSGGIEAGEFVLEEYYEAQWRGWQRAGSAGVFYEEGGGFGADAGDLLIWSVPVGGELAEGAWEASWLQVWLWDEDGELLWRVPPVLSPYGLAWESGWFRLRLVGPGGEEADVEGSVRVFDPLAGGAIPPEADRLRAQVGDLAERLRARDRMVEAMSAELWQLRDQLAGAGRMVDRLAEEREQMEAEVARMEEQLAVADPAGQKKLAGLEAEKALLEEAVERERRQREEAETALAGAYGRIQRQLMELEALEARLAEGEGKERMGTVPERTLAIVEAPMIIERPVPVVPERRAAAGEAEVESSAMEKSVKAETTERRSVKRRFGPRKFR